MFRSVRIALTVLFVSTFFLALPVRAAAAYRITDFSSTIDIARDTRLYVTETITAVFDTPKHGIYRTIPVIYHAGGRSINIRLTGISVTDPSGGRYKFTTSRSGSDLTIKIGDPDRTITGEHTYIIAYIVHNVLQRYSGYDELYWNSVGTGWDTVIEQASVVVSTPYAAVTDEKCFGRCEISATGSTVRAESVSPINPGSDLTFVVALDPRNSLVFPAPWQMFLEDHGLAVLISLLPALIFGLFWWYRGRDYSFTGSNVYSQEEGAVEGLAPVFGREHLPLQYSPIRGLTPAEAGTIIDMRVDLSDLVAEITELARLGYIRIFPLKIDRLILPDKTDYIFYRTGKDPAGQLKNHQQYLLDNLFNAAYQPKLSDLLKHIKGKEIIAGKAKAAQVSKMSGKFYTDLDAFKSKLYQGLTDAGYFTGRPDQVQIGWMMGAGIFSIMCIGLAENFNFGFPVWPLGVLSGLLAVVFGYFMGQRTAKGHALYRRLVGLKYFVGKGRWRYEIEEKHLFLEEILPLAVSLGVVDKLSRDMKSLAIEPPQYMGGMAYTDLGSFGHSVGHSLAVTPSGSSGGWSGGSGFGGGGFSGGGFGGGGGGSW